MGGTFTQMAVLLGIVQFQFHFVLQEDERTVKVTEELLRQHEEQRNREMAWLLEMERKSQEMAWLLEMEEGSQEPEHESLLACQHWWFWASAEMLLRLFGLSWLHRQGSSGHDSSADDSSACGETPAVPRRKRKRRRRRRKRMHGTVTSYGDKLD